MHNYFSVFFMFFFLPESMRKEVVYRRKMTAWRAILDDGDMCCSCWGTTKYTCLKCSIPICNNCSIFEEDEDYHGWVVGKSVAITTVCFHLLLLFLFALLSSKRKAFVRRLLPESMTSATFTIVC